MTYTTEDLHRDTLIGAIEGGTGYWALVEARDYDAITATLIEEETGARHQVTAETIRDGFKIIAGGQVANTTLTSAAHIARVNPDRADVDAELADVVIQAGLFGTIVYG